MSIINSIEEMKLDFLAQTGQDATDIYMGRNEIKILTKEVREVSFILANKPVDNHKVCGLIINKVFNDAHLRLGVEI